MNYIQRKSESSQKYTERINTVFGWGFRCQSQSNYNDTWGKKKAKSEQPGTA